MKSIKARYQYSLSEHSYNEMRDEIQQHALADGYRQGVAEVLYLLTMQKDKWGKRRLQRLFHDIDDMNRMSQVFDKDITGDHVIDFMANEYGIDVDDLKLWIDINETI